ncbi:MAG TPA: histone deacetylase [Anaerolineae bacterium]|nr:histone deacetylase [Anaerolineae bacterium]
MTTAYVSHPSYLEHDRRGHPEARERLEQIDQALDASGMRQRIQLLEPHPIALERLLRVHTSEHIQRVEQVAQRGGGGLSSPYDETYVAPKSYAAARLASGGLVTALEAVLRGEFKNAFALVRPPGHHAFADHGEGFCLINNLAIAALTARHDLGIERVLIVDFDVHHGNGTQAIFYDDPSALFFSTQQWGIYPGAGHWSETGAGAGAGYTVNVPLTPGWGDTMYARIFDDLLTPIARRFQPELMLVSAGYDPHWSDRLGSMLVTDAGFFDLTRKLVRLSEELCRGRLVLTLEGGYGLQGLAYGVVATFAALLGDQQFADPIGPAPYPERPVDENYLAQLRALHGLA